MKKIGLMTWYKYRNFGTALQVTALSSCVKELGYTTVVFNYAPRKFITSDKWKTSALIKRAWQTSLNILRRERGVVSADRDRLFQQFLKENILETQMANNAIDLADIARSLDAVICGSDQIWAPTCFDDKYFLSFVHNTNKMVSYAPSIGLTHIDNPLVAEQMAALISRFNHLTVREQQGADLIERLCGKKAQVVVDPTLLHDAKFWLQVTVKNEVPLEFCNKPYVLAYFLGSPSRYWEVLRKAEQVYEMPVYLIPVFKVQYSSKYCIPFEVGPSEFVQLFANAKYVLTDSFHGLAFSVNFNKPFTVFKRFKNGDKINQNSRIINLLSMTGLMDRLYEVDQYAPKKSDYICDFVRANTVIEKKRFESLQYLRESLQQAVAEDVVATSVKDLDFCCGCGACESQCPVQAISIQENENGFWEKIVDEDKCVHCKKCLTVCPFYQVNSRPLRNMKKLVAYKSECLKGGRRTASSSGAVGADLVQTLLSEGYVISGCAYDKRDNRARHICFDKSNAEKAKQIRGSKYIQSDTRAVMNMLASQNCEKVAFFGTPCQVAAVDKLLRKQGKRNAAVLIDLICHGVPSQNLWNKYISYIDRLQHTGSNPDVEFRSSDAGWRARALSVSGNGKSYLKNEKKDLFYAFFRPSLCYMPSCYECPYRETSSADIRIGDYWGPRFQHDKTGMSMVTVQTDKGNQVIENLSGWMQEYDCNEYWTVQYPYNHQPPIFYHELMEKLKNDKEDLYSLYKQYAYAYAKREQLGKLFRGVRNLIRKQIK